MKKIIASILFCPMLAYGAVIASMPNQAGGKIVLTDEQCRHKGRVFDNLRKAYFYTTEGLTGDGCWALEDEVVVVVWIENGVTRRYPAENFDIRRR